MSFLYGFLLTIYFLFSPILVLLILIQKGKSSMGLGGLGGGTQMLFGGSGGQDIFQKATWILGTIFIISSLMLSLMRIQEGRTLQYAKKVSTPAAAITDVELPQDPNSADKR